MPTRQGTLLEKNIEIIFKNAGFKTTHQANIEGYEIDVLAEYNDLKIVVECKQFEKSEINIRNLIHMWDSKNREIEANKVIIAVYGVDFSQDDMLLAKKLNIELWDEDDIQHYLDIVVKDKENAKDTILKDLNIRSEVEISQIQESMGFIGKFLAKRKEKRLQKEQEQRERLAFLDESNTKILKGLSKEDIEKIIEIRNDFKLDLKRLEEYLKEQKNQFLAEGVIKDFSNYKEKQIISLKMQYIWKIEKIVKKYKNNP